MEVHYSSAKSDWETPPELFQLLDDEHHFTLDVCANEVNHKCAKYFSEEDNALVQDWGQNVCWMNPPYDMNDEFLAKAEEAVANGATVVCLIPARTDTKYFHRVAELAYEIRFLKGRVKFVGAEASAPFPSAVVVLKKRDKKQTGPIIKFWDWKKELPKKKAQKVAA